MNRDDDEREERLAIRLEAMPSADELVESAIGWARRGYQVIDLHNIADNAGCTCSKGLGCRTPGKHPRLSAWQEKATSDEGEIRRRYRAAPRSNVGILMGEPSGVVGLDVDHRAGGFESLATLEAKHGPLPRTRTVATGGRPGRHLHYVHPGGHVPPRKAGHLGRGLDVKSDGGLFVTSCSMHASGARYELIDDVDPAPLPSWILDALLRSDEEDGPARPRKTSARFDPGRYGSDLDKRVERARRYLERVPPAIAGAGGHDQTWRAAMHVVRGFELPREVAIDVLAGYSATCKPPWSRRELHHKVDSAMRSTAAPGYLVDGGRR